MHEYRGIPEPGEDLPTFPSLAVQDSYQRGDKSSHDYPRKKKETIAGKPTFIRASRQQILAANNSSYTHEKKVDDVEWHPAQLDRHYLQAPSTI